MKTRTYQLALAGAVATSLLLAGVLAWVVFAHRKVSAPAAGEDPILARGPAASTQATAMAAGNGNGAEPALAPLVLTPQRMQEIGVTIATVTEKEVSDELQVPGNVDVDEHRLAYVQTRFPGWIQKVYANATYQYVHAGQPLFTVYSPDLVSSEQEYLLAKQNQAAATKGMPGMATQMSGWLLQAAEERLRQFDVPAEEIAHLEQSGKVRREITINSPVTGYILERNALPNAYVQPETKLYTVADLSTVWVYANVYQSDVGRLRPGDQAAVTVDAYPGRIMRGRIDQILPQVDAATRTVRVRLIFSNAGLLLKPGMYVTVTIAERLGRQLVVPSSALLHTGARNVAFVDHGNGKLEPRVVEAGQQVNDAVIVLSGLKAGERVVQSANFLLDSEAQLQGAMQGFSGAAAPQAATPAVQAEGVQIGLETEPGPPRRGNNLLRVRLTGAAGQAEAGAQVEVSFYMPAMPGMGMAAKRVKVALTDKGNGMYEGSLDLNSGGTWQVTVTAQRNGQKIATKQLSLEATGGMG